MKKPRVEPSLLLFVLLTVIAAWVAGARLEKRELEPHLRRALPNAGAISPLGPEVYVGIDAKVAAASPVGYASVGTARGYGGPLSVLVGVDLEGRVTRAFVLEHKETIPYFQRVESSGFLASLRGETWRDRPSLAEDIDAISGATQTTTALAAAASRALRLIARVALKDSVPAEEGPPFRFRAADVVLLLLFVVGFAGSRRGFRHRRRVRWITLLVGLLFLGFIYNIPLTIVDINACILGFWPAWQLHLHWYIMIVGVLLATFLVGRSPYCEGSCPFGAAQECLAVAGGAREHRSLRVFRYLRWLPGLLAWGAILVALIWRNPGLTSYEPFATLFDFTGSVLQFVLLGGVMVLSLFIVRPWCRFLCPIRGVTDALGRIRRWLPARR